MYINIYYNIKAGRYPELDILANKYFKNSNSRDETLKELNEKCIERENDCKYYLKYASKITEKGDDYIEKERDRLQKLSKSDSIVKEKRDNFVVRMNILNGFLEGEESVVEQKQEL